MKIAVVTGAAGGLGQAIRRPERHPPRHRARPQPRRWLNRSRSTHRRESHRVVFDEIGTNHGGLDMLVNNAGTCFMSDFPISLWRVRRPDGCHPLLHVPLSGRDPADAWARGREEDHQYLPERAYNFDVFDPPHYRAPGGNGCSPKTSPALRHGQNRRELHRTSHDRNPLFGVPMRPHSPKPSPPCLWRGHAPRTNRRLGRPPRRPHGRCLQRQRYHPEPRPRCPLRARYLGARTSGSARAAPCIRSKDTASGPSSSAH